MASNSEKQINLHWDILPRATKKSADFLSNQNWLNNSSWYLAGGTALALQAGHRRSVDLDFFNREANFDNEELLNHFLGNKDWEMDINKKNTVYGILFKAKVSFIAYPFFVPKQTYFEYGSIKMLKPLDVAVMKITAISQRGRKRDFFDLYWCAKNIEPLENLIKRLKVQYPSVAHDYHHILKSMIYFNDAESDPMPEIYFKASWTQVKNFFRKEIQVITKKILGLK